NLEGAVLFSPAFCHASRNESLSSKKGMDRVEPLSLLFSVGSLLEIPLRAAISEMVLWRRSSRRSADKEASCSSQSLIEVSPRKIKNARLGVSEDRGEMFRS
ncbi:MAG: hypothetical protein ACLFO3_03870, partial [Candidatus Acetothermia bacterium]